MPEFNAYPQHVQEILQTAVTAVDPARAVARTLSRTAEQLTIGDHIYDFSQGRVFVVAVGKGSPPMGLAAAQILGEQLHRGLLIAKRGVDKAALTQRLAPFSPRMSLHLAAHPVSDATSLDATRAVEELLAETQANDLVLVLVSGGTSALLTQPRLPLGDWQALNRALLASGCSIDEFNLVRRCFDTIKGGGLLRAAAPARVVGLILSDVIGNDLAAIGSGPTVPTAVDPQTVSLLLERNQILARLPAETQIAVHQALQETATLPAPDNLWANLLVADLSLAAQAAQAAAIRLGFDTRLLTVHLTGEAQEAGKFAAALARDLPPQSCLILGGETTVTLPPTHGLGGRNHELALAAAIDMVGLPERVVVSFATDGDDGPTGAAGAQVTGQTAVEARMHGLDPDDALARHDSHPFFRQLDATSDIPHLLITGQTGTNVNDLILVLNYAKDDE